MVGASDNQELLGLGCRRNDRRLDRFIGQNFRVRLRNAHGRDMHEAVDILEADNVANENTLSGDPFPGNSQVRSFQFETRSGTKLENPLSDIAENFDGIISFYYGILPEKELRYSILDNNGSVLVFLSADEMEDVYVYDTAGRLVQKTEANSTLIKVEGLHKNIIYIIKSGKRIAKIALR